MAKLSTTSERFILHWGEMGTRWGFNRTVAQIHALLFISDHPLPADEIAGTLSVARSNVSTSLRELQSWNIVKVVHVLGDRRDHFESMKDVWEMFRVILEERKRREVDPTIKLLRQCVEESGDESPSAKHATESIKQVLEFMETMDIWYGQITRMSTGALIKFIKLGGKIQKLLGLAS